MKELWCEAFGLDENDYLLLKNATPNGMSALHYGFQSKRLDFEVYKKWIQKKVNMPFLSDAVFTEKQTLAEMQLYCKKHQMLLIEGHESLIFYGSGHIKYVACFYPKALPDTPKTDVHYVLVSPESLAKLRELARMKPIIPEEQLKAVKARIEAAEKKAKAKQMAAATKSSPKPPPKAPARHLKTPLKAVSSQPATQVKKPTATTGQKPVAQTKPVTAAQKPMTQVKAAANQKVAPQAKPSTPTQKVTVQQKNAAPVQKAKPQQKPVAKANPVTAKTSTTANVTRPTRNITSNPTPTGQGVKPKNPNPGNKKKLG